MVRTNGARGSRSSDIRDYLKKECPTGIVLRGQLQAVASKFGVTRVCARAQAQTLGFETGVTRARLDELGIEWRTFSSKCLQCGKGFNGRSEFCSDCRVVPLTCEACGKEFTRKRSLLKYNREHGRASRPFCTKHCSSVTIGTERAAVLEDWAANRVAR